MCENISEEDQSLTEIGSISQSEKEFIENKISMNELMSLINNLSNKMDEMSALFNKKIIHNECEKEIVDKMHAELQRYKDDMYSQLVRPILLDIIEIRDSIIRISTRYENKEGEDKSIPIDIFKGYAIDTKEILDKNNVFEYKSIQGDIFNPIKQRAIKKVEINDLELHSKVAESLSSGYEYNGKTISAEKVAVYVYKKQDEENN